MNDKELLKLKTFLKSKQKIEYQRKSTLTNPQFNSGSIIGPFGSNQSVDSTGFSRSNEAIRNIRRTSIGQPTIEDRLDESRQGKRCNDEFERIREGGPKAGFTGSTPNRKDLMTGNLEYWWVHSPLWRRLMPHICIICILLGLIHLIAGITLTLIGLLNPDLVDDPYICKTEQCLETGTRTRSSMNESVEPCTDFYGFVCDKYIQNFTLDNPTEPYFLRAKTSYRKGNILASVLKETKSKNLLNFYKSCLNTPRRNKLNLKPFYEIMENDVKIFDPNVSMASIAASISKVAGRYGLYRYKYGKGSNIIFDTSPVKSQFDFLASESSYNELEVLLNITEIRKIVTKLNTADGQAIFPEDSLITKSRYQLTLLANCWNFLHGNGTVANGEFTNWMRSDLFEPESVCREKGKSIFNFYKAVEEAEGITLTQSSLQFKDLDTKNFMGLENGRIGLLSCCLAQGTNHLVEKEPLVRFTYKLFFMINAFRRFTINLPIKMQNLIEEQLPKLFLYERKLRQHSQATQCLFSNSYDYGAIFLIEMSKALYSSTMKPEKLDFIYTIFDAVHRRLTKGEFMDFILPEHVDSLHKYLARKIRVNFTMYNYASYEKWVVPELMDFKPNVNEYYRNCWIGRQLMHQQRNFDWKSGNEVEWIASGRDIFERLNIEIDHINSNHQITIPLPFMRPPYVSNDHRGLDFAGIGVLLTRAILEIPKTSLVSVNDPHAHHHLPKSHDMAGDICENCSFPLDSPGCSCENGGPQRGHCYTFFNQKRENFLSTQSIKVAYELYKNSSDFPVLIRRDSLEEKVVFPSYGHHHALNVSGHLEAHAFRSIEFDSWGRLLKLEYLVKGQVKPRKSISKYKLEYKTIIKLEKYTSDQIFFIAAVRHHCYAPNQNYKRKFNEAISHIKGFTKAFNCKPNDIMSYERSRCFY